MSANWCLSVFLSFFLHYLYSLDGIGDKVYKYSDELRTRRLHHGILHTDVLDPDILLVVKYLQLVLQGLVQIHEHGLFTIEFCECREFIGCVCKDVDMLQYDGRYLVEFFFPFRITVVLESYEPLDLEFYRRKRILDLMGHLTCHLTPCLVAFCLCKSYRGV